jgi:natural product biosynthesis luciferase-like monooxygenase protein
MVSHRNVVNFFAGISALDPDEEPGVWLAVTTISFDISVLELLWTLSRGFKVVITPPMQRHASPVQLLPSLRPQMQFSLFYFECDEEQRGERKYRLVLEGARFADEHGFTAIWTPERHFHAFGGLYPNPSVVGAAIAAATRRVGVRAGSVVLPLHDPLRVAEEWAVVDGLSGGRVGLAFAPGSHPNDFVFAPDAYPERKQRMLAEIETVRGLWRGESIRRRGGNGEEVEVKIFPRPVQAELSVWLTSIGIDSFRIAGERGYHVLTHLLFHDLRELTEKIVTYRQAWREHGHLGTGHVTLMVHTYVGETLEHVRRQVETPLCDYLRSSADLFVKLGLAKKFNVDTTRFTEEDLEAFVDHAFERFFDFNGLLGTPETCASMVETLKAIGVDELACLIDFGISFEGVMEGLQQLDRVRQRSNRPLTQAAAESGPATLSQQILEQGVTHLQCTPAMAQLLLAESAGAEALASLRKLFVGGDVLPLQLAQQLAAHVRGEVRNMYGPTETTVWSTTAPVRARDESVAIGRPLANTQVYVLDQRLRPVPIGATGELFVGGDGVARGYYRHDELTAERFIPDPFRADASARLYRTGDQVRFRTDGTLEFLGRLDHQVKLRGFRIELGEIEAELANCPGIRQSAVVARHDPSGDKQLVAFVVGDTGSFSEASLQASLRNRLPFYMVPSRIVEVDSFPLNSSQKIDREKLLALALAQPATTVSSPESIAFAGPKESPEPASRNLIAETSSQVNFAKWRTPTERSLVQLWRGVLETDQPIGIYDDFFTLGGHSLQAAMVVARIRDIFRVDLPLRALFEARTIAALSERIDALLHRVTM